MDPRDAAEQDEIPELPGAAPPADEGPIDGPIERVCEFICEVAIVVMAAIVIVEIVTRNVLNISFQVSDELGGYIIVGITFLSLSVCQVHHTYHHVQFVQTRLSPRMRAFSHLIFNLLSLLFCGVLIWQLTRMVLRTWDSGDVAPTVLATPLWIPQAVMPIGAVALFISLTRATLLSFRQTFQRRG